MTLLPKLPKYPRKASSGRDTGGGAQREGSHLVFHVAEERSRLRKHTEGVSHWRGEKPIQWSGGQGEFKIEIDPSGIPGEAGSPGIKKGEVHTRSGAGVAEGLLSLLSGLPRLRLVVQKGGICQVPCQPVVSLPRGRCPPSQVAGGADARGCGHGLVSVQCRPPRPSPRHHHPSLTLPFAGQESLCGQGPQPFFPSCYNLKAPHQACTKAAF